MSEEGKIDVKETIDTINEEISKKMDQKFQDFGNSLDEKLDKLKTKPEDVEDFEENNEDDDVPVTKGDLKNFGKSIVETVLKKNADVTGKILEQKTKKQMRDAEAAKHFPKLNKESSEFDQKFFDEVLSEMKRRAPNGPGEDPDLIYDSAAVVQAKMIASGTFIPKSSVEEFNRKTNNRHDNFDISGTGKTSKGPTQEQIEFGKQFGLKKDDLDKYMKTK